MLKKSIALLTTSIMLISSLSFASAPPKNRISMEQAETIAIQAQPGKIEGKELEYENQLWIYSFDIRAADHKIHEIHVDAVSGKVVGKTIESTSHEKAEAASEKK